MSSIASKPSKTGRITLNLSHIPGLANAVADTLSTKYYEQKNRKRKPSLFLSSKFQSTFNFKCKLVSYMRERERERETLGSSDLQPKK